MAYGWCAAAAEHDSEYGAMLGSQVLYAGLILRQTIQGTYRSI